MPEEFKKNDDGKPDLSLIPYSALCGVAHVMRFGAEKYSQDNWRKGDAKRYVAAGLRHAYAWSDRDYDDFDHESGHSHLAHAACCLLFALALEGDFDGDE